ncbi:MAG: protein-disulfide reductase DsbD [Uliginosibacterium sp.]|nr:protein-disulfide reductase DsbD [Uliginosibacterium sp.]
MKKLYFALMLLLGLLCAPAAQAAAEPLPPEQAFQVSAEAGTPLRVSVRIAPGYYVYRDKFSFTLTPAALQAGAPTMPPGLSHTDAHFGEQIIYRDHLSFTLPYTGTGTPETLSLTLQGCADIGICYPPTPYTLSLTAQSSPAGGPLTLDLRKGLSDAPLDPPATPPAPAQAGADEATRISRLLDGGNLALIAASFFGFGLLLSFTPCTLPMVPIVSSIIVGHGHKLSHRRAFALSSAYVLGMAVTYAGAGVLAGFSGQLLSVWLQNVWVLGAFALIFVVLALSMFGLFELQIPARWQHKLSASAHHHAGSMPQLAIMGAISALIVGPCVAAPLAGALLYIAKTHDAVLGGLALFALGLGMGLPLIIVGVAARRLLPKPGGWMEGVKRFFGLVLLGTALYLVSPVLPPLLPMLGWAALLITGGVFLRAIDPLPDQAHAALRLFKAIGILLLLAGAAIFIGALAGSRDPLQPLAGLRAGTANASEAPRFTRIKSNAELDAQLAASTRPVMLDFYADWCVSCKEMEHRTFADPQVAGQLASFTLLQADVTDNTPDDRALLKRFGLFGPPGILFFRPGGEELAGKRVIGFMGAEEFAQHLRQLTTD